jgi:hypothetical protein
MPQLKVGDSFEDQLEQGQAQAGMKPTAKKPVQPAPPPPKLPPRPRSSGLDWLEQGFGQRQISDDAAKKAKEAEEKKQREQLERLKALDRRRSKQMYEEIQQAIQLIRKKKKAKPPKYITGAAGYDPQQHQDPEGFWEKLKKKQAEAKKKLLPWTSKQGMGTGEITRGVAG